MASLALGLSLALASTPTAAHAQATTDPSVWDGCGPGFECTSIEVPWDYADPAAGSLTIPLVRHPATGEDRLGVVVFNPGGPGIAGTGVLTAAIDAFPAAIQEHFDLVSFDPRGTGGAEPIDCGTDVAALFAFDPLSDAGGSAAAWAEMANVCAERLGEHLGDYSTEATVNDVERIREALGEDQLSWLVTSYGTRLGAEYLRRHPDRVRAMVLDSAMDPSAPLSVQALDMATASGAALARILALCFWQDPCPLGDDPSAAYDALMADLRDTPLTTEDGRIAGVVALQSAAQTATALPFFFAQPFVDALVAAQAGDGSGLLGISPGDYRDPLGGSTFDAQWVILCNDEAERLGPKQAAGLAGDLDASASRTGLGVAATWGLGCQGFPAPSSPISPLATDVAAPVLVVGSTGDPTTSLAWSERTAAALDGARLLTRAGDGHTAFFWSTFYMGCTGAAISDFLLDPATALTPESCND